MANEPRTRPSLVLRIGDPRDEDAWDQFVKLYTPLIHGFSRKQGLQEADAADLTQEVLRVVARSAARLEYDPARGSFRGWLFTIVRNKLRNFLASPARQFRGSGDSKTRALLDAVLAPQPDQDVWEAEYERRLFDWAAEQVRAGFQVSSWQAFWRTAVENEDPKAVAVALGMTVGAVYIAKSRVLARLRRRIREVHDE
jgi:RNA polymerase sigma-70 factor (ECF subfamily)